MFLLLIIKKLTQLTFPCSLSTIETLENCVKYVKTPERRQLLCSDDSIVNFEHISLLFLVFLLLTLNK